MEDELRYVAAQVNRKQVSTGIDKCRVVIYNARHKATDILGSRTFNLSGAGKEGNS